MAQYKYNGVGDVIRTNLQEAGVFSTLDGTSARTYTNLDRFGRIIGSVWTKDLSTDRDFYSVAIAYDRSGNPTRTEDNVHTVGAAGSGNGLFDVAYSIDNLDRVSRAKEGHWDGSAVTDGNRKRDQIWTLDQLGNWDLAQLDWNGDGAFAGTDEYDDNRTHNLPNEITARDLDNNAATTTDNYTPGYDKVGNLTDDDTRTPTSTYKYGYLYEYDVFGRLRRLNKHDSGSGATVLVAEYRYNGLGYRIGWHYDVDGDGTVETSGEAGDDPWFYFVYDHQWRLVATFRASDTSPKEGFVYHNAGSSGHGGSSYIDSVICRERDANTSWASAADGTMEERRYYCQNWRADVSAVITSAGKMVEWVKYLSHGAPIALPAGDTDSDGGWDATDSAAITGGGSYDVRKDADLDGDNDSADVTHANSITGTYQTLGNGALSSTAVANRKGYAGYENDGKVTRFWHVRRRVLDSTLGRWTRRDPAGYVDGMGTTEYTGSMPLRSQDASGQKTCRVSADVVEGIVIRSVQQCCRDYQDQNPGYANYAARTFCCDGRPVICVNPQVLRFFGDILACTLVHERVHYQSVHCPPVLGVNDDGCFDDSDPSSKTPNACDECRAYRRELDCLDSALQRCMPSVPWTDPTDGFIGSNCQERLEIAIEDVSLEIDYYCSRCSNPAPQPIRNPNPADEWWFQLPIPPPRPPPPPVFVLPSGRALTGR